MRIGGFLFFRIHFGGHSTGGDYWTFAFDSLQIIVPEPSGLVLLFLLLPGLLLKRSRSSNRPVSGE